MVRTSSQQSRVIRLAPDCSSVLLVIVSRLPRHPSRLSPFHHIPTLIFLGVSRIGGDESLESGVMVDERTWEIVPGERARLRAAVQTAR
jgi:hypothetical protein